LQYFEGTPILDFPLQLKEKEKVKRKKWEKNACKRLGAKRAAVLLQPFSAILQKTQLDKYG